MSGKNSAKVYVENGYYHIYNRGVEKRLIFQDAQDYGIFLSYLKDYLSLKDEKELRDKLAERNISSGERDNIWRSLRMNNFSQQITLLAYCLMPNHFHLLIKQKNPESIDKFMNSLSTRYVMYFNRKYQRVGALYQDVYKAVLVNTDEQFLHLSRYIHKQSLQGDPSQGSQPSSYPEYIGARNTLWIHTEEVLSFFSDTQPKLSYEAFVKDSDENNSLVDLILDN